ncbi:hypothetical protein [Streptomyces smaragdinus]|uniref:hypothetical protein n=1 Tax=Streptomyces smaragdinus TaxID=2585196 RepID=UPI00129519C4|nr:hypothetical protein [Streptomyces smaragdinus]
MLATPDQAPVLRGFDVITDADVRTASDHGLLAARFSLPGLRSVLTDQSPG